MNHEYCGIVEEVGGDVGTIEPGRFVVGSFAALDNTCAHCALGLLMARISEKLRRSPWTVNACGKRYVLAIAVPAYPGSAEGLVKAASPAQRGRSKAKSLDEPEASRRIAGVMAQEASY